MTLANDPTAGICWESSYDARQSNEIGEMRRRGIIRGGIIANNLYSSTVNPQRSPVPFLEISFSLLNE
jgi:hypothetical protein